MGNKLSFFLALLLLLCTSCEELLDKAEDWKPPHPQIKAFATHLTSPLGIETDAKGQLWVTEAGTGLAPDGQLTLITPQGNAFPVVKGFFSRISPEGAVFGLNHLVLQDGMLWMLHGVEGKLYKFDISSFQPGDAPVSADELQYDDIGSFVKNHVFPEDTDETDIFNLTIGPEGDLFIVDAAANAIIRRKATTGALSVFATIPPIANPDGEPAVVEAVPTGIVFDGQRFLVCSFTGYPFPAQAATIYQVDLHGTSSVYQTGLASLADIGLGTDNYPVVIEYGTWTGETFAPNSGRMVLSAQRKNIPLLTRLNFPNAIERAGPKTYYIAQTFDGVIQKVTF